RSVFSFWRRGWGGFRGRPRRGERPFSPCKGPVTARRTARLPDDAFVMNFFEPFRTQTSPSRTAVVFVPLESEPASASVSPHAASHSPVTRRGRYFRFCASLPN